MSNQKAIPFVAGAIAMLLAFGVGGCEGALAPKRTPNRVVIGFLKEIGRNDYDAAREWVAEESIPLIESWDRVLYFPDVSNPPTEEDGERIDDFISLFYRITTMEEGDTTAKVHLVFVATDAIINFPDIADDPLVPNSAPFMVALTRPVEDESEDSNAGDWKILSLEPITETR